ncbi:hypothetical protein FACS1894190_02470 [Spirochaetia bacterium]|nr:hypothetical protein FACS1894190_02470 [Spirochaetia bacterium]
MMEKLGAIISIHVTENLYGVGRGEDGMLELKELIIYIKDNERFYTIKSCIPGYESFFDGTINKKTQDTGEINPDHLSDYAKAYLDIGLAYRENKDYNKAIENFQEAIRIDRNCIDAYLDIGQSYREIRDYDKAIENFQEAIRIDRNCLHAYFVIGMAYNEKRDHNKAIENFSEVIRIDRHCLSAYMKRGENYFKAGDLDNAINDITYCIKMDPSNESAKDLLQRINKG